MNVSHLVNIFTNETHVYSENKRVMNICRFTVVYAAMKGPTLQLSKSSNLMDFPYVPVKSHCLSLGMSQLSTPSMGVLIDGIRRGHNGTSNTHGL